MDCRVKPGNDDGEIRALLVLSDIGEIVGDLELDQHILVGRVLTQHGAVSDPLGNEQHVPGCMIFTPISVSHFSAPLTQKMISCASMLRCQKPMSCLRRLETSTLTRSEV